MNGDTGTPAERGDVLVRMGAFVFCVGALATVVTVTPLLIGAEPLPTAAYAVSMLMAAGFALAAAGLLVSVARQRRELRRALGGPGRGGPPARPERP